jgi:uncharacterized membrane protein YgcG
VARGDAPAPLSRRQRRMVERAVDEAENTTGLQFCVYLGDTEGDPRAHAETLFVEAGLHTRPAVLLLVAPNRRRVELVTAPEARSRVDDDTCALAVGTMTRQFARGDIAGGLVAGLDLLAAAAGAAPTPPGGEELPDLLG